jgi:hypothetical protein
MTAKTMAPDTARVAMRKLMYPGRRRKAARRSSPALFVSVVGRRARRCTRVTGAVSIDALPGAPSVRARGVLDARASSSNGSGASSGCGGVLPLAGGRPAGDSSRAGAGSFEVVGAMSPRSTCASCCCVAGGPGVDGSDGVSSSAGRSGLRLSASAFSSSSMYSLAGQMMLTCCPGAHGASSSVRVAVLLSWRAGSSVGGGGTSLRYGGRLEGPRRRLLDGIAPDRLPGYVASVTLQLPGILTNGGT